MPLESVTPGAHADSQALVRQITALDAKWTREFKGLKTTVSKIRTVQTEIQKVHENQAASISSQANSIRNLEAEFGRMKPLTTDEQKALANLVSSQLAQQIIKKWVGSIKGKVIGVLGALAVFVTLAASIATLFRHGF